MGNYRVGGGEDVVYTCVSFQGAVIAYHVFCIQVKDVGLGFKGNRLCLCKIITENSTDCS